MEKPKTMKSKKSQPTLRKDLAKPKPSPRVAKSNLTKSALEAVDEITRKASQPKKPGHAYVGKSVAEMPSADHPNIRQSASRSDTTGHTVDKKRNVFLGDESVTSSHAHTRNRHKKGQMNFSLAHESKLSLKRKRSPLKILAILFVIVILGCGVSILVHVMKKSPDAKIDSGSSTIEKTETVKTTGPTEPDLLAIAQANVANVQKVVENTAFDADTKILLDVPIYKQTFVQSCEVSSLRMALAYREITTDDATLLEQLGGDEQPAKLVDNVWQWGDPHETYVGYRDGDQEDLTGYGVYAEPIAKITFENGRAAETKNEPTLQWLATQIYAGNPVVLWGVSVKQADAEWVTPTGKTITAPMMTHTRLVVGVIGDPNNPKEFIINDPGYGGRYYWTADELAKNIAAGINQAVAVY
jgi:uncharacterized protein YvpB